MGNTTQYNEWTYCMKTFYISKKQRKQKKNNIGLHKFKYSLGNYLCDSKQFVYKFYLKMLFIQLAHTNKISIHMHFNVSLDLKYYKSILSQPFFSCKLCFMHFDLFFSIFVLSVLSDSFCFNSNRFDTNFWFRLLQKHLASIYFIVSYDNGHGFVFKYANDFLFFTWNCRLTVPLSNIINLNDTKQNTRIHNSQNKVACIFSVWYNI